jgi:hypothetical protein
MLLLIGMTILAFAGTLGWYGHKASLRIAAWGEGMNQRDRILCGMAESSEYAGSERDNTLISPVPGRSESQPSSAWVAASR